jgi:hypothetical protein
LVTRVSFITYFLILAAYSDGFSSPELDVPHRPPHPDASGLSWVKLNGGEWIGGEIISMNDGLEFRSKNLGILQLEWEIVDRIYTTRKLSPFNTDFRNSLSDTTADVRSIIFPT